VRVVDGAYLIWRQGASGGMVKLRDLPEDLRTRFGYDPSKAAEVYSAYEEKRALATAAQIIPRATSSDVRAYSSDVSTPSSGGRVYVRGYTRKDGTYVAPYTRSAPRRR